MLRDLRFAARSLLKSPGFTIVAVATLALGIGANTTIFSLINGVLLKPLPYDDPDKLVALDLMSGHSQFPWSYPMFEDLRRYQRSFESVAGFVRSSANLTGIDNPIRLEVELASASYFRLLGIEPAVGRVFRPEEDRAGDAHPVALLSFDLWRRQFAGDSAVVGRTIHLNQTPYTVVGVMPPGFRGQSDDIDLWIPITMEPVFHNMPERLTMAWNFWLRALGRLKPGVTLPQASAQMAALAKAIDSEHPHPNEMAPWQVRPTLLAESKTDPDLRKSLIILFAAVGLVLLIACVNVANLLLSRSVSRQKEVAVRLAVGASRSALIRQFLTESILLGLAGGVAGSFVAAYGIDLASALRPGASGFWGQYARAVRPASVSIDGNVLAFNVALSILAGVLFGLLPALHASSLDLNQALKSVTGGWSARWASLRRPNSRSILITGEMALALVLLAGAGLMVESFARLLKTHIGAATDHVLTATVELPRRQYTPEAATRFQQRLLARLATAPGVQGTGVGCALPARGLCEVNMLRARNDKEWAAMGIHMVSPGYFSVFRIPLVRGRFLTDRDRAGTPHVLLLGESAARHLFGGENPIGKHVELQSWGDGHWDTEVVGLVGDVRYDGVEHPADNDVYVSQWQLPQSSVNIAVRVAGNPMSLAAAVRGAIHALDKDLPVYDIETMDEKIAAGTSRLRFSAVLLGVFAALALALAAIGLYGVVAYSVAARTREIGIRLALGAKREDVFKLVIGDGLLLSLAGLAIGIPSALAATRVLSGFLYNTKPGDPIAFAAVSMILVVVALVAAYVPARRATRVDPMVALRYE